MFPPHLSDVETNTGGKSIGQAILERPSTGAQASPAALLLCFPVFNCSLSLEVTEDGSKHLSTLVSLSSSPPLKDNVSARRKGMCKVLSVYACCICR